MCNFVQERKDNKGVLKKSAPTSTVVKDRGRQSRISSGSHASIRCGTCASRDPRVAARQGQRPLANIGTQLLDTVSHEA